LNPAPRDLAQQALQQGRKGFVIAHFGGFGHGGWRGALRVAQRQAPLRGDGLGKLGGHSVL